MPTTIDGRRLLPPEPLVQTMAALEDLERGDEVVLLVNHQPRPLYRLLQRNGFAWREAVLDSGSFEIHIFHQPAPPAPGQGG